MNGIFQGLIGEVNGLTDDFPPGLDNVFDTCDLDHLVDAGDVEILAVSEDKMMLEITVDSGAGEVVAPLSFAPDYPAKESPNNSAK